MRAALAKARATHLENRKENYFELLRKTASLEDEARRDWQPYFDLCDKKRWLLAGSARVEGAGLSVTSAMASELNEFALRNQREIDREYQRVLDQQFRESRNTQEEEGIPFTASCWEEWAEELGENLFELLSVDPAGRWEYYVGPTEEKETAISIKPDGTANLTRAGNQVHAIAKVHDDGELVLTGSAGPVLKLRWRSDSLTDGRPGLATLRFKRSSLPFAAVGQDRRPGAGPVRRAPEPGVEPQELIDLRTAFEKELGKAEKLINPHVARLVKQAEYAQASGRPAEATQFRAEQKRIGDLPWRKGRVLLEDIRSSNPLPAGFQPIQKRFEQTLYRGIARLQSTYLDELADLSDQFAKAGKDGDPIENEMEFFLKRKQLDLTEYYNATWDKVGDWYSDEPKPLEEVVRNTRSLRGLSYKIGGIIQLNSGTLGRSGQDLNRRIQLRGLNKKYPDAVHGIPVYQKAGTICLLGACVYSDNAKRGETVARLILKYDNLDRETIELENKVHLDHWFNGTDRTVGMIVGRGGDKRVLFEVALANPHPGELIATIDLESAKKSAAPFFLAITLD